MSEHRDEKVWRRYYCNACGTTVERASGKRWIKSYCDTAGRTSRLWRVTRFITAGGERR